MKRHVRPWVEMNPMTHGEIDGFGPRHSPETEKLASRRPRYEARGMAETHRCATALQCLGRRVDSYHGLVHRREQLIFDQPQPRPAVNTRPIELSRSCMTVLTTQDRECLRCELRHDRLQSIEHVGGSRGQHIGAAAVPRRSVCGADVVAANTPMELCGTQTLGWDSIRCGACVRG